MSLEDLGQHCSQESERFFNHQEHDPQYCYELFRRAFLHDNEFAWELIYRQYHRLVTRWVERHALYRTADEESDYFANRAFEKMWRGLTPEKFDNFPDLKSLLRYLQMCTHSVMIDYMRRKEQAILAAQVEEQEVAAIGGGEGKSAVEQKIFKRERRADFWQWLRQQLNSDEEYKVIHSTYVLSLQPREILELFPETFQEVQEIYRTKENVLARLRRREEMIEFLGDV
jgi:DNA-directed RNA polymerase specialized sigma24 family protein